MNERAVDCDAGLKAEYDAANAALWQAESDYEGAVMSRDPKAMRAAREPFREAQNRYHRALGALVDSRRPTAGVRPTFEALLNDPTQQLDTHSEVLAAVYRNVTSDTACACTNPKCPRHYRGGSDA